MSLTVRNFPITSFPVVFPGTPQHLYGTLSHNRISDLHSREPSLHIIGIMYTVQGSIEIIFDVTYPVMLSTIALVYGWIQELAPGIPVSFRAEPVPQAF